MPLPEAIQDQALLDAAAVAARGRPVTIVLPFDSAITLIATVQLALRHPGNVGLGAQDMRKLVTGLIDTVATTPALRAVLEAGFDPHFDVQIYQCSICGKHHALGTGCPRLNLNASGTSGGEGGG